MPIIVVLLALCSLILATEDFEVKKGDRIAQLILEQVCMVDAIQVEELDDTVRGAGGFGSTGVDTSLDAILKRSKGPFLLLPPMKTRWILPPSKINDCGDFSVVINCMKVYKTTSL